MANWSQEGPYERYINPPMAGRTAKPRTSGVTMVIDKGLGITQTRDLFDLAGRYVDYWKLPFGTAHFYPTEILKKKIALCRAYDMDVYPGGTYLEVAIVQGALERFLDRSAELGFTAIEVSDGTVTLAPLERRNAITQARSRGFKVVSEVGKKDTQQKLVYQQVHREIEEDLAAGVSHIIVEGRESGTNVGIYNDKGAIQEDELTKIVNGVKDLSVILWEAPLKTQQEELIVRFGPNVNLGNIPTGEIIALEALRNGLRADTLKNAMPDESARDRGRMGS